MKVKCIEIKSPTTGENLGCKSPWLTVGKEYVVLALIYVEKEGFSILILSDQDQEPCFMSLNGFEIISQNHPSIWTTKTTTSDNLTIDIMPQTWQYEDFFDDLENQEAKAIRLFKEATKHIYAES